MTTLVERAVQDVNSIGVATRIPQMLTMLTYFAIREFLSSGYVNFRYVGGKEPDGH